jgi:DNA-binding response OmpR family regulator
MVDSHPGEGSVFRVWLPIQHNAARTPANTSGVATGAVPAAEDDVRFPSPPDPEPGKPIILVVEDNRDVAGFVASCLREEFAVLLAADGGEGVTLAVDRIPDLVVSDVMMPVMDGFALCRELKTDIRTSHVPVILLTGRGDHPAVMEGLEVGADAYVVKPFEPAELRLRVRKLLELRKNLRQYYLRVDAELTPAEPTNVSARDVEFISSIRGFIEDHLTNEQFNMQMLCRHIGMSHPQLHRKIVALTGESTGRLVRSVRLGKAIGLLREPGLTVAEVAYRTGFSDPGYFTKVFVRDMGMTPSEYRARARNH